MDNARLFAQLNLALADAAITAWDAKYAYEYWRPITAIHQGSIDGNEATVADTNWAPLLISPPFPEYVSGHSTFSGAAAEILTELLGENVSFTTSSFGLPGVLRSFGSFQDAAEEAGRSRIYVGIHFEFSNQDGLAAGRALAQHVLQSFSVSTDVKAPAVLIESPVSGSATSGNIELQGRVIDNLSGVAFLEVQLDDDAFVALPFETTAGQFSLTTALLLHGSDDGQHTYRFRATDYSGNSSLVEFHFTLDTQSPVLNITSPLDNSDLSSSVTLNGIVDGTGSSIVSLSYAFNGGTPMPILFDASGGFNQSLDLMHLATGSHELIVSARDEAGNVASSLLNVNLPELIPLTILRFTPLEGASEIGTTYRPQVYSRGRSMPLR